MCMVTFLFCAHSSNGRVLIGPLGAGDEPNRTFMFHKADPMKIIPDEVLADLKARYAEPQRAYHTWDHIAAMLTQFEQRASMVREAFAFKLAVLFHDAIYDPTRDDNEARSAQLLEAVMKPHCLIADIHWAQELVMLTMRHTRPPHLRSRFMEDGALFMDMDLSILGADERSFDAYDAAIRKEYSFVPEADYRRRRAELLEQFLQRERIYFTDDYHKRLEAAARANLARAIAQLREDAPQGPAIGAGAGPTILAA
jgi:predicted metal-dependent HD superfamily phosphohydrolase